MKAVQGPFIILMVHHDVVVENAAYPAPVDLSAMIMNTTSRCLRVALPVGKPQL